MKTVASNEAITTDGGVAVTVLPLEERQRSSDTTRMLAEMGINRVVFSNHALAQAWAARCRSQEP